MVNVEDLKIKNLVILESKKDGVKTNNICRVSGIDEDETITLRSLDGEQRFSCKSNNLKPIKLSLRLIREIGFEKDFYQELKYVIKSEDGLEMAVAYREKRFFLQLSYFHDPDDALGQIIEHELEDLDYLHQFQNIYQDFTGKKLDVKDFFKTKEE